jgi:hypothetical protein
MPDGTTGIGTPKHRLEGGFGTGADDPPDEAHMSFAEWCKFENHSPSTGKRRLQSGDDPGFVWVSKRRMGLSFGNYRRYCRERAQRTNRKALPVGHQPAATA